VHAVCSFPREQADGSWLPIRRTTLGEFEVTLTYRIEAEDMHKAAAKIYRMISEAPPVRYWVVNEGGVGEEIEIPADERRIDDTGARPRDNVLDLAEELLRVGIMIGSPDVTEPEDELRQRAETIRKKIADLTC
jgi:hypothetical protein